MQYGVAFSDAIYMLFLWLASHMTACMLHKEVYKTIPEMSEDACFNQDTMHGPSYIIHVDREVCEAIPETWAWSNYMYIPINSISHKCMYYTCTCTCTCIYMYFHMYETVAINIHCVVIIIVKCLDICLCLVINQVQCWRYYDTKGSGVPQHTIH